MNVDLVPQALDVLERAMHGQVGYGSLDIVRTELARLRGMEARAQDAAGITGPRNEWWAGWRAAGAHILNGP